MTNLINRLKLARLLKMFGQVNTAEGVTFNYEGDLEVGTEVFMEDENGELIPVNDGTYTYDEKSYLVEGGKVIEITEAKVEEPAPAEEPVEEPKPEEEPAEEPKPEDEPAPEPEPEEEPKPEEEPVEEPAPQEEEPAEEEPTVDEKDARIAELEAEVAEKDARIAELEEKLKKAEEPLDEPAEEKFKKQEPKETEKGHKRNIIAELRKFKNEE